MKTPIQLSVCDR